MRPAGRRRLQRFERAFSNRDFTFCDRVQFFEQAGCVQQPADEPARRPWKIFDERWGCDDLVIARQVGLLIDVNHFQPAIVPQLGLAQLTDAQDGLARSCGGPSYEKPQDVLARTPRSDGLLKGLRRVHLPQCCSGGRAPVSACFHGRLFRSAGSAQVQSDEQVTGIGKVANGFQSAHSSCSSHLAVRLRAA
jgi:hypothetical protein